MPQCPFLLPIMRRPLIVLLLTAVVAVVSWRLWQWQGDMVQEADPWSAVPDEAEAVLEVPAPFDAWERLTRTSQFWGEMDTTREGKAWTALVGRWSDGLAADPGLAEQAKAHKLVIAFMGGSGATPALIATALPRTAGTLALVAKVFHADVPGGSWNGEDVVVRPDSAFPALVIGWEKGLLLVAENATVLGAARKRLDQAPRPDALFAKARSTFSAGGDAHLLVEASAMSRVLGDSTGVFPDGAAPEGWFAFDVRLRPGAVLMNGLLLLRDPGALAVLRGQAAGPTSLLNVLPPDVVRLRTLYLSDVVRAVKDLSGAEPGTPTFSAAAAWVSGNAGIAEAPAADGSISRWAVLGTDAPVEAERALSSLCPDAGCATTEYRGVPMRELPGEGLLASLFGSDLEPFRHPLWCILGDLAVFAGTPREMRAAIDAWTDRNSLALDPRSGDFFTRFATDATYSWWIDASKARPHGKGAVDALRAATGGTLLQLTPRSDGAFVATLCAQHAPNTPGQPGALWTTAMASPLEGPPLLVRDYLSKTIQILAQDRDHRISLISCTGKVLWQYQLDGPLLGGVEQVDRYRNGKLQMVLGTAGAVHMIDRLGRDVEGFPVKLPITAAAPLTVVDYDGNKDYRILVPLQDGSILNLAADGKAVQGWSSPAKGSMAISSVDHARIQGKDYLIVPQRNGSVEVVDRKGAARYVPKLRMQQVRTVLGTKKAMDIAGWRLQWEDSTGAVIEGSLSGETDTLDGPKSGAATLITMKGDGPIGVVRTTATNISGTRGGKALFHVSFPDAASTRVFPVPFPDGTVVIGQVLPEQDQVRAYTLEGMLLPGFPLAGATVFSVADINLDGVLELVTANAEGVVTVHALPAGP